MSDSHATPTPTGESREEWAYHLIEAGIKLPAVVAFRTENPGAKPREILAQILAAHPAAREADADALYGATMDVLTAERFAAVVLAAIDAPSVPEDAAPPDGCRPEVVTIGDGDDTFDVLVNRLYLDGDEQRVEGRVVAVRGSAPATLHEPGTWTLPAVDAPVPSRFTDEYGRLTVAGAEAMFAAQDEVRARGAR